MATLEDLIAALNRVSDAYSPDPNEDDSDDTDEADKENAEDEDGADEDDFSKPKIFSTVMLLQKLEQEADLRFKIPGAPLTHRLNVFPVEHLSPFVGFPR